MALVDDLKAAKALIADEAHWNKGGYKSADGLRICSSWAVAKIAGGPEGYTDTDMYHALEAQLPKGFAVVCGFNDEPTTTHADIMALFDRAIASAS